MLNVKTPNEVTEIINDKFGKIKTGCEKVHITKAPSRVLAEDIRATEFVPDFNRSTVDGYAVVASSTFGCSESIPAILDYVGEVQMGQIPTVKVTSTSCAYVPTGGEIPDGADAMVMIEYVEDYGDGTRSMLKPSAPGQSIIFKGDDVKSGDSIFKKGEIIKTKDIGSLASLGIFEIDVVKEPKVAVISTGDELIDVDKKPQGAQIRDVNSYTLCASIEACGCEAVRIGIIEDDYEKLKSSVLNSLENCDMLLISGGSSVGVKDATFRVIDGLGEVYLHGIAIKPGKPTIVGEIMGKPVFGLPGHPLASFFIFDLFIKPLLYSLQGVTSFNKSVTAQITTGIPSNHGREECIPVKLIYDENDIKAEPIIAKSGLISVLASSDGYLRIPRDCEGISKGEIIKVNLF